MRFTIVIILTALGGCYGPATLDYGEYDADRAIEEYGSLVANVRECAFIDDIDCCYWNYKAQQCQDRGKTTVCAETMEWPE